LELGFERGRGVDPGLEALSEEFARGCRIRGGGERGFCLLADFETGWRVGSDCVDEAVEGRLGVGVLALVAFVEAYGFEDGG